MKIVFRCPPELQGLIPEPVTGRRALPELAQGHALPCRQRRIGARHRDGEAVPALRRRDVGRVPECRSPPTLRSKAGGCRGNGTCRPPRRSPIRARRSRFTSQTNSRAAPLFEGDSFAVKFTNYWTVALPPGIGLLCTHPANRLDLPFRHRNRPGARRCLRELHSFSGALDRCGLQWGPASRHAGGAVLSRAPGASRDGTWGQSRVLRRRGSFEARSAVRNGPGAYRLTSPLTIDVTHLQEVRARHSAESAARRATRR